MSEVEAGISNKAAERGAAPTPEQRETEAGGPSTQQGSHGDGQLSESERSLAAEEFSTCENTSLIPSPETPEETRNDLIPPRPEGPPVTKGPPCLSKGPSPCTNGASYVHSKPSRTAGRGAVPVQSPPLLPPIVQEKQRLDSTSSVCTSSSRKSRKSFKSTASQIQRAAGDDCCAHCFLDCLFCEFQNLCTTLVKCLSCSDCGNDCGCCCCCRGGVEGYRGEDDSCSCDLDCGMLEDCCESSDCLEICFECCSICFPA
ncbi:myoD family inhibitor-like [Latimeria chalumnae]|uniref:myoD family inhibitor-like n=1 Tax=Latimeria chalumnae TaxID=7897 RepID=UPI00313E1A51